MECPCISFGLYWNTKQTRLHDSAQFSCACVVANEMMTCPFSATCSASRILKGSVNFSVRELLFFIEQLFLTQISLNLHPESELEGVKFKLTHSPRFSANFFTNPQTLAPTKNCLDHPEQCLCCPKKQCSYCQSCFCFCVVSCVCTRRNKMFVTCIET